jgi:exosortase
VFKSHLPSDSSQVSAGQSLRSRSVDIYGSRGTATRMRTIIFFAMVMISLITSWNSVRTLIRYSLSGDTQPDRYSYTIAIPFICAALVIAERKAIFARLQCGFRPGLVLLFAGLTLKWYTVKVVDQLGASENLSLRLATLVLLCLAAFMLCYGEFAFRAGAFPLLFLVLMVPVPVWVLEKPITIVQYGSAEVCAFVFRVFRIPALRNGLEFSLSNVSIVIAKQCSGIHSTIAIILISLIAGHIFLVSSLRKLVLVAFALPIVCVTNGLRIAVLTLLAEYVNPDFLAGSLHRRGGVIFFLLAVLLLSVLLHLLRNRQFQNHFVSPLGDVRT